MDTEATPGNSSGSFHFVPPDKLSVVWHLVRKVLESHPRGWETYTTPDHIANMLLSKKFQLWVGVDHQAVELVVITEVIYHPKRSVVNILWIGGSNLSKFIRRGLEAIEHSAALSGMSEVQMTGRKGFERILKPFGYGRPEVTLRKDVRVLWRS